MEVTYPDMRVMVVRAVQALSDPEYQWRVWIRKKYPQPGFYDDFTARIDALDDLRMRESPEDAVGGVLRNYREAQAIRTMSEALEVLFNRWSYDLTDEQYLRAPEWAEVVKTASAALQVLNEPNA